MYVAETTRELNGGAVTDGNEFCSRLWWNIVSGFGPARHVRAARVASMTQIMNDSSHLDAHDAAPS